MNEEERSLFETNTTVCSLLDRLSKHNLKHLSRQIMALDIDNFAKLESFVELIFEKAIIEPGLSEDCANFCHILVDQISNVPTSSVGKTVSFRKRLIAKCQAEFKKGTHDDKQLATDKSNTKLIDNGTINGTGMLNDRQRMLGIIRFICELHKLQIITENIMHHCINDFLKTGKQESLENQIECLCALLTTVGKLLDHQMAKPKIDVYFNQMKKIVKTENISPRIKLDLQNVIDLRDCNWGCKQVDLKLTTNEVHKKAEQNEQEGFDVLVNKLRDVRDSAMLREEKISLFEDRIIQSGETEEEFLIELVRLFQDAYLDHVSENTLNISLKRKFLQGISSALKKTMFIFVNNPYKAEITRDQLLMACRSAKDLLNGNLGANIFSPV